jgi:hypothetical protein
MLMGGVSDESVSWFVVVDHDANGIAQPPTNVDTRREGCGRWKAERCPKHHCIGASRSILHGNGAIADSSRNGRTSILAAAIRCAPRSERGTRGDSLSSVGRALPIHRGAPAGPPRPSLPLAVTKSAKR